MNLLKNKVFCLITIIVSIIVILLVLFNTILYNYKMYLNNNLNDYYTNNSETAIENINNLCERYKNNKLRLNSINSLINSDINSRINKYNDSYDTIESLKSSTESLKNQISNLLSKLDNM